MAQKNKTIESSHIHPLLPFNHDGHVGKSQGWDEPLNPQEGASEMAKGKKAQISKASQSSMQSHRKENGKDVMVYNDITWA